MGEDWDRDGIGHDEVGCIRIEVVRNGVVGLEYGFDWGLELIVGGVHYRRGWVRLCRYI